MSHISLGYRKEFSDTFTAEGKFTYSKSRDNIKYDYRSEDFYGIQQLETNGYEATLDTFFTPSTSLSITSGLYYRTVLNALDMADLPSFGIPTLENRVISLVDGDDIVTRAFYTQINYNLLDNLKLVMGARLEQSPKYGLERTQTLGTAPAVKDRGVYERDNIEFIPRLAAIYYLNENNIFKFLYGKAINRPSFAQNYRNSLNPLHPELEPENIETFELNYISSISQDFTLNASLFRNILNNLITRIVIFDVDQKEYESWSGNAGKMITNGIELTLKVDPLENLRLELSGTYQQTEDKRPGYEDIAVAYSPKFLGYLNISYHTEKLNLGLNGHYVGAMETFWDETIENPDGSFGARIGEKVDEYFVMGANLRIKNIFWDGLYLNVRCSNLLNGEIRYPTFTNNPWADRGTIGIGRSFLVTLGYKF
jgi:hypothetical protein